MEGSGPLNQAHCDTLTTCLAKYREVRELLAACRDCDLDTAQLDEWLNAQQAQAEKLKRRFFPHCP
jgi:hypothetical protein